jgi:Zn-dependent protease with chaperone function
VTDLFCLGGVLFVLGVCAGPLLSRMAWCKRIPRVATLAWLGALSGTLAAAVGIVVMVLVGRHGVVHLAAKWLKNCPYFHAGVGGPGFYALNALLLGGTFAAAGVALVRYRRTVRQRRRHQDALRFVVQIPVDLDDVCVLDHPLPVIYCIPARRRPIVVSKGALDRLEYAQLHAVLAHERAHLKHRHHLVLTAVDALAAALFWLPTYHQARRVLPLLLEMTADDIAARHWSRDAVAMALRKLAISPSPAGGLAAGGSDGSQLEQRLSRLAAPAVMKERHLQRLTWAAATMSMAVPLLTSASWIAATHLIC